MAQLLIGTTSVDVLDVALVAPRGSLSTVYLADNSFLESALTPAAQRTAINGTASGTVLTTAITSTNFGDCYVGAGNVQRIDASADALGCRIELRGGPGAVIAPARIAGKRTPAGRYTNHSAKPNAVMVQLPSGDIDLVASRHISGCAGGQLGEEITIDYRQALRLSGIGSLK